MIAAFFASKFGMKIAGYAAIALAVLIAIWRIFAAGKNAARIEGMKEQLGNADIRAKTDDAIASAIASERDRLRAKWTRT